MPGATEDREAIEKRLKRLAELGQKEVLKLNWERSYKPNFELTKAACLSLFAEMAYLFVTEDEYRERPRSKLIPCYGFQSVIRSWPPINVRSTLTQTLEGSDVDIIQTRAFVSIVIHFKSVTVVAVRGTAFLYDWYRNFSAWKSKSYLSFGNSGRNLRFHSGFLREARILGAHLEERVYAKGNFDALLIVTGHSLGGAIAALVNGGIGSHLSFNGCYTFAAPRISDASSLSDMRGAPNLVNEFDIVPRVPPSAFGYDNHLFEFNLSGTRNYPVGTAAESHFLSWLSALAKGQLADNHFMEVYRTKVRQAAAADPI